MHNPQKARAEFQSYIESQLVHPDITGEDKFTRLAQRLQFMQANISTTLYRLLPRFLPLLGPAVASLRLLTRLAGEEKDVQTDHGFSATALEVTRGLPNNVTTEMDLVLWKTANAIRQDQASYADVPRFRRPNACLPLSERNPARSRPNGDRRFHEAIWHARGGVRSTWVNRAGGKSQRPLCRHYKVIFRSPDEMAPDALFEKGAKAAELAVERLAMQARRGSGGEIKEKIVRALAGRIRMLMGLRESPKFFIVRLMGIIRSELLASGDEFVREGIIEKPEDLFFLHFHELQALANRDARDWKTLIAERRNMHERENRRRQIPRVLVSDGRAFYEGIGVLADTDTVISGSPVSPGVAEGIVHIIFDPRGAQLAPGEILVCPGTDPAWTPLFMAASGLITEVGGMMTHGSVVAREYGIPAVVGVHQATTRLKDGQRIRIDGTAGKIMILEE